MDFEQSIRTSLSDKIITTERTATAPYSHSISASAEREIAGILFPRSAYEVQTIVQVARKHGASLYPVSQGKGWGLGSKLPSSRSGQTYILDLGKHLRGIQPVNTEHGIVEVETGVTQQQLFDNIEQNFPSFTLDATGTSPEASIVGCILDNGLGFNNTKLKEVIELTVVTGEGKMLTLPITGHDAFSTGGNRPLSAEIFIQSNFGIVISATIKLWPKHKYQELFVLTAKTHEQFATGLPKIGRLIDEGTIQCIPHAFNKRRLNLSGDNAFISRLTRNTPWITLGRLTGETREILKSKRRHMRKALSRHFKVMHFGRTKIGVLEKTARLLNMPEQNSAIKILNKFFDIFSGKPSYLIMPLKINTPLPNLLFSPLTLLPVWLQGRHSSVFGTRSMSEIA